MKLLDLNHPIYLKRLAKEINKSGTRPQVTIPPRWISEAKYSRNELFVRFFGDRKWYICTMNMRNNLIDGETGNQIIASRETR